MAFSNAASKPAKYHLLTVVVCVAVVDRGSVDRRVVVSSSCVYFLHTAIFCRRDDIIGTRTVYIGT
jgi:hypothetical protein